MKPRTKFFVAGYRGKGFLIPYAIQLTKQWFDEQWQYINTTEFLKQSCDDVIKRSKYGRYN